MVGGCQLYLKLGKLNNFAFNTCTYTLHRLCVKNSVSFFLNPCLGKFMQTVLIQISPLLKKLADQDLHGLSCGLCYFA